MPLQRSTVIVLDVVVLDTEVEVGVGSEVGDGVGSGVGA